MNKLLHQHSIGEANREVEEHSNGDSTQVGSSLASQT